MKKYVFFPARIEGNPCNKKIGHAPFNIYIAIGYKLYNRIFKKLKKIHAIIMRLYRLVYYIYYYFFGTQKYHKIHACGLQLFGSN